MIRITGAYVPLMGSLALLMTVCLGVTYASGGVLNGVWMLAMFSGAALLAVTGVMRRDFWEARPADDDEDDDLDLRMTPDPRWEWFLAFVVCPVLVLVAVGIGVYGVVELT